MRLGPVMPDVRRPYVAKRRSMKYFTKELWAGADVWTHLFGEWN
jgi:hypothetical protein